MSSNALFGIALVGAGLTALACCVPRDSSVNDPILVLGLKEAVVPMRFSNGPIMKPISTDRNDARQGFAVLATYKSELYRNVKQIGTMTGTPAIVSSRFGQGTVLLFSTHPEGSPRCSGVLSRSIRLVAPHRSSTDT